MAPSAFSRAKCPGVEILHLSLRTTSKNNNNKINQTQPQQNIIQERKNNNQTNKNNTHQTPKSWRHYRKQQQA